MPPMRRVATASSVVATLIACAIAPASAQVGMGSLPFASSVTDTSNFPVCTLANHCVNVNDQPSQTNMGVLVSYLQAKGMLQNTNIPSAPLLGGTAGSFQGVSLGSGLSLSGGVLSATGGGGPPPAAPLLGSTGASFTTINVGTGLSLTGGTLSNAAPTIPTAALLGGSGGTYSSVSVGSGLSLIGGTLTATASGGTPGGSAGQLQFNNAGAFGGLTISGDATLNPSTGVLALNNVNSTTGTYAAVNTNAKGLVTGGSNLSGSCSTVGSVATCPLAGSSLQLWTKSGPTTNIATQSGTIANGHVAVANTNGDLVDGGVPSGGGGSLSTTSPNLLVANPSGSNYTINTTQASTDCSGGTCPTSGSAAISANDATKLILLGAHAYTIGQATGSFGNGWGVCFLNTSGSGNATVTATTSTWIGAGGSTLLVIGPGAWACPTSNGTNYLTQVGGQQIVLPAGGGVDDAPRINAAFTAGAQVVTLDGGTFNICSTVDVPRNKVLRGPGTGMYFNGSGGQPDPWPGATLKYGGCGFPSGGSILHMHDNTTIYGFAIQGNRDSTPLLDCVDATNSVGPYIHDMVLMNCANGVLRVSDGANPGDTGSITQEAHITHNTFWYVYRYGIYQGIVNSGSGVSDERYIDNEFEVAFGYSFIKLAPSTISQVIGNRLEDGSIGIECNGCNWVNITGNITNRVVPLIMDGTSFSLVVAGNTFNANTGAPAIQMYGSLSNSIIGPNFLQGDGSSVDYKCTGCTLTNTQIYDSVGRGTASGGMFDSNATRDLMLPFFVGKGTTYLFASLSGTTYTPAPMSSSLNVVITPSPGTCSSGCTIAAPVSIGPPAASANDTVNDGKQGIFTVIQPASGTGTFTFASGPYRNPPTIGTTPNAVYATPFTIMYGHIVFGTMQTF